jgi:signal peptidase II
MIQNMKKILKNHLFIYLLGGLLFFVDRLLKFIAYNNQDASYLLLDNFGWEYFANNGVAFGLPLPSFITLIITPIIMLGLILFFLNKKTPGKYLELSIVLIILGAVSNFVDRMLYDITIDYIRIYTSVINLADIMIVGGVILLLLKGDKK